MLSFFRWLVGCWHDWNKWQNTTINGYSGQFRYCNKCGKKTLREVYN